MSDVKQSLQDKLAQLEKGLFLMSVDRVRALSVHETVELIEELRAERDANEKAAAEAAQEAEAAAWLEAKRVSQEAGEGEPTDEA